MKQRTTLLTLFLAGALVAPAAFAQDATSADEQAPPTSSQTDSNAQQATDSNADSATSGDASDQQEGAAYDEQGKTSGDAGMPPPTAATPVRPTTEETTPTDHGRDKTKAKHGEQQDDQQDDQQQ